MGRSRRQSRERSGGHGAGGADEGGGDDGVGWVWWVGGAGEIGDGWGERLGSLDKFEFEKYGIAAAA